MKNNKTKYLIFAEYPYILDYGDFKVEVSGEEILNAFRESSYIKQKSNNKDGI
jgi:hypothetical protein